jgi:hypothetical protein
LGIQLSALSFRSSIVSFERQSGRAAERQSGRAAERQSGRAAKRQSGRAAEIPLLFSAASSWILTLVMADDKLTRYQKQQKGKQGQSSVRVQGQLERRVVGSRENVERAWAREEGDRIDSQFDFERLREGLPRIGWLLNYLPITMPDESGIERSGLDLYFIEKGGDLGPNAEDYTSADTRAAADVDAGAGAVGGGLPRKLSNFKATLFYEPYLYLDVADPRRSMEVANALMKKFPGSKAVQVEMEDLDLPNHLSGKKHPFLKLSCNTERELLDAKQALR